MTNGQRAEITRKYVEGACNAFLTAHKDVVKAEYRNDRVNNGFIKVTTALGFSNYYDVTDLDCGDICQMLSAMMVNGRPNRLLKDREAIREVERLFAN